MPSEIRFPITLTRGPLLKQKPNKQISQEKQKNLDGRCINFHFVNAVEKELKTSQDDTKLCHPQLSVNKTVSRCSIYRMNSQPTNQNIKIGRRA